MKAVAVIAGAAIAANAAAAAAAAAKVEPKEDVAVRKTMFDYARCVVRSHHDAASRAIVEDANNSAITRQFSSLIDSSCLGRVAGNVQMTFGGDLYRYALADALVNQDFAADGPDDFADRLPLAHVLAPNKGDLDAALAKATKTRQRDAIQNSFDREAQVAWLSRYGECVARVDPKNVRLWLPTPPGGPEEISRINSLRPAFSSCLEGGTLTFNRTTMRGTVALNYYRLAMATSVPAARKAN